MAIFNFNEHQQCSSERQHALILDLEYLLCTNPIRFSGTDVVPFYSTCSWVSALNGSANGDLWPSKYLDKISLLNWCFLAGGYMYVEATGVSTGSFARLMGPVLVPDESTKYTCWVWKYHMYGAQMGTLNIKTTVRINNLFYWVTSLVSSCQYQRRVSAIHGCLERYQREVSHIQSKICRIFCYGVK